MLSEIGCSQTVTVDDVAISISQAVHHKNKGALGALEPSFTLEALKQMELEQIEDLNERKKMNREREKSHINFKKRKTIYIVHGAFHYLHLFPVRGFVDLNALNLGHYQENMISLLDVLRQYLGPDSLVIWATAGTICDEKLEGMYAQVLANLKEASRHEYSSA